MILRFKGLEFIVILVFLSFFNYTNADSDSLVSSGGIPKSEYIIFNKDPGLLNTNYLVKYLPKESFTYGKDIYAVNPTSIWWHWDAGSTPKSANNINKRVLSTYDILKSRGDKGEHVSTHFTVGLNTVLQMLPLGKDSVTQARLTNDLEVDDVLKSLSLGGIQIETTGMYYDTRPPLASQTNTLIKLTAVLMKQYNIPFSKVFGHLEVAPGLGKTDPGIKYLKQTRIKLLKYLISRKQMENIGSPDSWNFYTQVLKDGVVTNVLDQSSSDILNALTKSERQKISDLKL